MSKLREAAQAVIDMFYHRSWGTTSYIPASVEALRDALAEHGDAESDARLIAAPPQRQPLTDLYNELLFAVGNKHPNETRHQTALRYIQQAEVTSEASIEAVEWIEKAEGRE